MNPKFPKFTFRLPLTYLFSTTHLGVHKSNNFQMAQAVAKKKDNIIDLRQIDKSYSLSSNQSNEFKARGGSFLIKMLRLCRHYAPITSLETLAQLIHEQYPNICYGDVQIILNRVKGIISNKRFESLFRITPEGIYLADNIEVF